MREVKKHWAVWLWGSRNPLCGAHSIRFANAKRKVTCKTCQRILAGYQPKQGEVK